MINTAVDSRCYELHEHIDADRFQLLYHSEVKWLSRGLVLKLWFELKNEVFTFLTEKKNLLLFITMPTQRLQQNLSISVTFFHNGTS